ncbi:hypothetical protein C9F11_43425 (plasmid) [Streptomyces sp. YIM 121038]|uniref:hypothetical protein n=1 Tax=Streptomyces sp. YIM 121038 TaxID=2136401 RepID=UPI001110EF64|nr:hypothetical protein [Streptomyces sp. YIM 121038]QCX82265.1 hypothetical protein C9F11_43425 [Streptomyces sp. YIM 121038]
MAVVQGHRVQVAGKLADLGDSWIETAKDWGTAGLKAALIVIVVVVMVQRLSLKAGIGALILMVIALGIYSARDDLAGLFKDEVENPSNGAPAFDHGDPLRAASFRVGL